MTTPQDDPRIPGERVVLDFTAVGTRRFGACPMRHLIRVKPLDRVFRAASELDAKVARVAVLYEDLRLENLAASEEAIPRLDGSGVELRKFYFVRRSIATVWEFAQALRMLSEDPEFLTIKDRFDGPTRNAWLKSVRFFARREHDLARIRHDFGGHFGHPPARYAMSHLHDGVVVCEMSVDRKASVRFKFASEIVAIGMRRHERGLDSAHHFRLLFGLALAGFGHAGRCAQILAAYDVWPRFR